MAATDGLFEQTDTMTLTFSESVTGVAASSNVVITDKGGSSNNDGVSMSQPAGAARRTWPRATTSTGNSANFNSSALSQPAANQVKVTLAACTGSCANLTAAAGTGSFQLHAGHHDHRRGGQPRSGFADGHDPALLSSALIKGP